MSVLTPDREPETTNLFLVGAKGDHISVLLGPALQRGVTVTDALNLAAWLVAMSIGMDPEAREKFDRQLEAVLST